MSYFIDQREIESSEFESGEEMTVRRPRISVQSGGLINNMEEDQKQIMRFHNEGVQTSSLAIPDIIGIPRQILKETAHEDFDHSIQSFLSRPINVFQYLHTTATNNTPNANLMTLNFPDVMLSNSMYAAKLRGFLGLRAKLVLRLQVNSMPFQQGRFILSYIPYAKYIPGRAAMINSTLSGVTGCPRVDLDLSTDTECSLTIPYVSPYVYYDLPHGSGTFGTAYLTVYSPLVSSATADQIGFTLWAHFEDVEVAFPTGAPLIVPEVQSSEQEVMHNGETTNLGPPTSAIGKVVSDLENFSLKPSWVAQTASNIASLFGFSKPTNQSSTTKVKQQGAGHMCSVNAEDNSHPLGMFANNLLEDFSGLDNSTEDQMDFLKIATVPNYIDKFSWNTSAAYGTTLYKVLVEPMQMRPIDDHFSTTHCSYLASSFGLWRGSLNYIFKFVKTKFHSGRVRVAFLPGAFSSAEVAAVDVNSCYSQIVDLRTATEFNFKVPFVSTRPYLAVRGDQSELSADRYFSTGSLIVQVVNELINAQDAYATIDVLVEFSGGEDIEFAAFQMSRYVAYQAAAARSRKKKSKGIVKRQVSVDESDNKEPPISNDVLPSLVEGSKIEFQSLGADVAPTRSAAQNQDIVDNLTSRSIVPTYTPSSLCVGERIQSLRQVLKRFTLFYEATVPDENNVHLVNPWSIATPMTTATTTAKYFDLIDYFSYLFAFFRGGIRLKFMSSISTATELPWRTARIKMFNAFNNASPMLSLNTDDRISNTVSRGNGFWWQSTSEQIIAREIEGFIEIEIPFYSQSYLVPLNMGTTAEPSFYASALDGFAPLSTIVLQFLPDLNTTTTYDLTVYRAVADDFSFNYLLGVPPVMQLVN